MSKFRLSKWLLVLVVVAEIGNSGASANRHLDMDQISFEEDGCSMILLPMPVESPQLDASKITLCSDGTAYRALTYSLKASPEEVTPHQKSKIDPKDFARLCDLIRSEGFYSRRPKFSAGGIVCDDGSLTLTVIGKGYSKSIFSWESKALLPLRKVRDTVHQLTDRLDWEPALPASVLESGGANDENKSVPSTDMSIRIIRGPSQTVDSPPAFEPKVIHL